MPRYNSLSSKILIGSTQIGSVSLSAPGQVLIVGGGGGAGGNGGGGGGGGGLLYYATTSCGGKTPNGAITINANTTYSISVGCGGGGGGSGTRGSSGNNSAFAGFTSLGGGGGASRDGGCGALSGGSGGGGSGAYTAFNPSGYIAGSGTCGQGFAGRNGTGNPSDLGGNAAGGGGGGASAVGTVGTSQLGGNGGAGYTMSITGLAVGYAGGGAGGVTVNGSSGNASQGGNRAGNAGTTNTGGGGGGGDADQSGGSGGRGIVILAYPSCFANITSMSGSTLVANGTTAPNVPTPCTANRPGYKIYKFTAGSGNIIIGVVGQTPAANPGSSGPAPSLITSFSTSNNNSLTYNATLPSNAILLAHFGHETNSSGPGNITAVSGGGLTWTKLTSVNAVTSQGQSAHVWYAINNTGSGIGAFTVTWSGSSFDDMAWTLSSWSGVNLASPFVGGSTVTYGTPNNGQATLTVSNSVPYVTHVVYNSQPTSTAGYQLSNSTQVAVVQEGGNALYEYTYLGYKQISTIGSQTYSSSGSGQQYAAIGLVLTAAT